MAVEKAIKNPLILNNIIRFCGVAELKTVRLVTHSWYEASLDHWRKTAVLLLGLDREKIEDDYEDDDLEQLNEEPKDCLKLVDFLDRVNDPWDDYRFEAKPFKKYRLYRWNFRDKSPVQAEFWSRFGPVTVHLYLDDCRWNSFRWYEDVFTVKFPNLKTLILSDLDLNFSFFDVSSFDYMTDHEDGKVRENFQRSVRTLEVPKSTYSFCSYWGKILYNLPNLQNLIIRDQTCNSGIYVAHLHNEMFDVLMNFAHHSQLPGYKVKIETLDFMDFFIDAAIDWGGWCRRRFSDMRLADTPLKTFTVDWGYKSNVQFVNKSIQCYSKSLEVLKAFRAPISNKPFDDEPLFGVDMLSLCELHLWGNTVSNFEFFKFTPNLRKLVMSKSCYEKQYKLTTNLEKDVLVQYNEDLVLNTENKLKLSGGELSSLVLRNLEELSIDYEFTVETISLLGMWMPNVKKLKMILTNDTLQVVCHQWPNLVELEGLFGSDVDDAGLVALTECKDLRSFTFNAFCNQSKLTAGSCQTVFLKMIALMELKIYVGKKVNNSTMNELRKKLLTLNIIYNSGKHNFECCKRAEYNRVYVTKEPEPEKKSFRNGARK